MKKLRSQFDAEAMPGVFTAVRKRWTTLSSTWFPTKGGAVLMTNNAVSVKQLTKNLVSLLRLIRLVLISLRAKYLAYSGPTVPKNDDHPYALWFAQTE